MYQHLRGDPQCGSPRVTAYPANVESDSLFCHFPHVTQQCGEHSVFSGDKLLFDQPLDVERINFDQHVIVSMERVPFHARVQPEKCFDDPLHLRCVVRDSCGADVEVLTRVDLHWSTGLHHRLVPRSRTLRHSHEAPSSTLLSSRHIPGGSIFVNVQLEKMDYR